MPRWNKVSRYETQVTGNSEAGQVIYRGTAIVTWDATQITLYTGGWASVTTKRKMNQTANEFGLRFGVFQRDHAWYVDQPNGETVDYGVGASGINREFESGRYHIMRR